MSDSEPDRLNIDWTKIIVAFITATITLIGTLGTVYLKYHLNQNKDPITRRLESGQRLNTELIRIMKKTDASRVTVAQFHNGSKFSSGRKYEKISTTHQVVAAGVSRSRERVEGLPITLFEDALLEVKNKSVVHYDDPSDIPNVGSLFREEGVESVYIFKLQSVDGKYVGVLFLEYTERRNDLTQSTVRKIKSEARAIGSYLSSESQKFKP